MSDIELAIGLARKIETALTERGAVGSGLREKAQCFATHLSPSALNSVSFIASERNNIAHADGATLRDRAAYERACEQVHQAILAIPADARAEVVQGENGRHQKSLFESPSYDDRDLRRERRFKAGIVIGLIATVVTFIQGGPVMGIFVALIAVASVLGQKYLRV
jgi:hypothetical protein